MGNCLGVIYMFDLKNKKNKKPYEIIHESSDMSQEKKNKKTIVKKDTMLNDNIFNIKEDHLSEPIYRKPNI